MPNLIGSFLRGQFDARARRARLRLLARIPHLNRPDIARSYHDELLFCAAYPDNQRVAALVDRALKQVGTMLRRRIRSGTIHWDVRLEDSGVDGTMVFTAFSIPMLIWLAQTWPRYVAIDWDDDSLGEAFEEFLPALACRAEWDGLLADRLSTRQWLRLGGGKARAGEAAMLARMLKRLSNDGPILDRAWESAEVYVKWRLAGSLASTTLNRFPRRKLFFQDQPLVRSVDPCRIIADRLPASSIRGRAQTQGLINTCRAALAVRGREIDTLTYVNRREVSLFQLDRGIDVALFGLMPERRLPIESYFGFMAARNRVPVAYGGGWVLGDRAEIGVNIFDAFRGGESAFLFAQVMRVYRQRFGASRFFVDPFQFGRDNPEAIASGAFWFYYRLGFRPVERKLNHLAARHWERIVADRKYRCSARVLRRLATGPLGMDLTGETAARRHEIKLSELGLAVTKWIGAKFCGDRARACETCVRRVSRVLNVSDSSTWPADERAWFTRLTVLVAMIPGVAEWSDQEKRDLLTLMRAKGGASERRYAKLIQGHGRLRLALEKIARSATSR